MGGCSSKNLQSSTVVSLETHQDRESSRTTRHDPQQQQQSVRNDDRRHYLDQVREEATLFVSALVLQPQQRSARLAAMEARTTRLRIETEHLRYDLAQIRFREIIQFATSIMRNKTLFPTRFAAMNGHARSLEGLIQRGAHLNLDHRSLTTCVMVSSCFARPECTRLLIQAGADVTYPFPEDSSGILYMMVLVFLNPERIECNEPYRKGDYVLTADLLVDAYTPVGLQHSSGIEALFFLCGKRDEIYLAAGENAGRAQDCKALISIINGEYWREYGGRNPFLHCSTAGEATRLLMTGAANDVESGHVDITRARSIAPRLRREVMAKLNQVLNEHKAFVEILLTVAKKPDGQSPFGRLSGHEPLLHMIADYFVVRGRTLRNVREAKEIFDELASGEVEHEYEGGDW